MVLRPWISERVSIGSIMRSGSGSMESRISMRETRRNAQSRTSDWFDQFTPAGICYIHSAPARFISPEAALPYPGSSTDATAARGRYPWAGIAASRRRAGMRPQSRYPAKSPPVLESPLRIPCTGQRSHTCALTEVRTCIHFRRTKDEIISQRRRASAKKPRCA